MEQLLIVLVDLRFSALLPFCSVVFYHASWRRLASRGCCVTSSSTILGNSFECV